MTGPYEMPSIKLSCRRFIEMFCYVRSRVGKTIPFALTDFQLEIFNEIEQGNTLSRVPLSGHLERKLNTYSKAWEDILTQDKEVEEVHTDES